MTCKYLSIRQKNYIRKPYCKIKKQWQPNCENCKDKEYKVYKPIKPYSKKRAKLERERYSIFTNNLNLCIENKNHTGEIDKHEIFSGKNRLKSMKYGLVVPLCRNCHENPKIIEKWQKIGRLEFIKMYGEETFIKEFQTKKGE
ncbi:MAG TPA: hypothetical protein GX708_22350 [Gallicola sp.]|nr:hypothetical protein [Gallicola sp.]